MNKWLKVVGYRLLKVETHKFSFETLEVFQKARELVAKVYRIQKTFPKEELFGLCDQLRRASVSITANLAEGSGRQSLKEKKHFIEISYGSLMEVFCELQTACDLNYITDAQLNELRPLFTDIAKMLSGLRNSLNKKLNSQ